MNNFDDVIIYEITKYLETKDYLNARFVWRISNEIINDTLEGAIWLTKKGFHKQIHVHLYMNEPTYAMHYSNIAVRYALIVIAGRWPPGEAVIMTCDNASYLYAFLVLKQRWIPGERIILKHGYYIYWYAKNVLNRVLTIDEEIKSRELGYFYFK
jgi:hypothetical protein